MDEVRAGIGRPPEGWESRPFVVVMWAPALFRSLHSKLDMAPCAVQLPIATFGGSDAFAIVDEDGWIYGGRLGEVHLIPWATEELNWEDAIETARAHQAEAEKKALAKADAEVGA